MLPINCTLQLFRRWYQAQSSFPGNPRTIKSSQKLGYDICRQGPNPLKWSNYTLRWEHWLVGIFCTVDLFITNHFVLCVQPIDLNIIDYCQQPFPSTKQSIGCPAPTSCIVMHGWRCKGTSLSFKWVGFQCYSCWYSHHLAALLALRDNVISSLVEYYVCCGFNDRRLP
jgi:hypothetical protein